MKALIKVITGLLAVAGVLYWVMTRLRPSRLRMELKEMDERATELGEEQEEEEAEETTKGEVAHPDESEMDETE